VYRATNVGGTLPPAEVNVYGDGSVKGSFASVPDIATIAARAVNDPTMRNREIRIVANTVSQNELIDKWRKQSGKTVMKVPVPAAQIDTIIVGATAPDQMMTLIGMQLHRSVWIRGDAAKKAGMATDVQQIYPDIELQTIDQAFARLL
jgi:nucleoside-diphosphate-sugar epimerase